MKLLSRILAVFIVIPALIAILMWQRDRHGFFNVKQIELVIDPTMDSTPYLKPLLSRIDQKFEKFRGQSMWNLNLEGLSKEMESETWIESHSISRRWPSGISVRIRPFEVKAILPGKSQKYFPVIAEGRLLEALDVKTLPDAIFLEGEDFSKRFELRRKAIELISELPTEGEFSKQSVSELKWNSKDGFTARLVRQGVEVKLGEGSIAIKAARIAQVLEYLKNRDMIPLWLDSNLSKKVLVRLKDSNNKSKSRFHDLPFAPPTPLQGTPMMPLSEVLMESSSSKKLE